MHVSVRRSPDEPRRLQGLLSGSRLELDDQLGGHPSAVFYLDALRLGPLTDLGGVQPAHRAPAPASGRPPGTAASPPGSPHIPRQRVPQFLGVPGVQVDSYLVPSSAKWTVPSAALPSRSSMNRVCTFWATATPFLTLAGGPS